MQENKTIFSGVLFHVALFLLLVALAAALRFYKLGHWSFGFDEPYTIMETRLFWDNEPVPEFMYSGDRFDADASQFYRLPKLLVAGYFVHWIDLRLFGDDEFGSRFLMAVMGSLCVGIVYLLARPLFGCTASLVLALLLLFWPDHVLQSQNCRFYCQAFLLLSVLLLLGAHIAVRRSVAAACWAGPVAILLVLTHSFGGLIWGILLLALLFDFFLSKRSETESPGFPWKPAIILGLWSILLLGVAWFHIRPLAASWNSFSTSGTSPVQALISLISSLGWPYAVLCVPAFIYAVSRMREPGQGYWLFCLAGCLACVVALPLKIVYYPYYSFLFAFPFYVVFAVFVDRIYGRIVESNFALKRFTGLAFLLLIPCLNLPLLGAYFLDGGRYDYRSACRYINEHWRSGDRLTCFATLTVHQYIPELQPKIPLPKPDQDKNLQEIIDDDIEGSGRLWCIILSNRHEPNDDLRRCLSKNSEFRVRFGKQQFNFFVRDIEIYLVPARNDTSSRL